MTFGNTLSNSGLTAVREFPSRFLEDAKWTILPPTSAYTVLGTNCAAREAPSAPPTPGESSGGSTLALVVMVDARHDIVVCTDMVIGHFPHAFYLSVSCLLLVGK